MAELFFKILRNEVEKSDTQIDSDNNVKIGTPTRPNFTSDQKPVALSDRHRHGAIAGAKKIFPNVTRIRAKYSSAVLFIRI